MANINEILARAAALRNETALNSIDPERAGGIMYDTLLALNELWLQQGAALVISKIYASVAAMNADTSPVSDLTGKPIRPGMVVVIASSDSDNGSVYRYNGTSSPRWSLVGKIGNITPEDSLTSDSTQLPLAAHQGKVLDGKISQLGQQVIYDVSANNGGATFASLSALLSSENLSTLIPIAVRCGGMSIRFVQTSDNKYVQCRLMANEFTTDVAYWVNDEALAEKPISGEITNTWYSGTGIGDTLTTATQENKQAIIDVSGGEYFRVSVTGATQGRGWYIVDVNNVIIALATAGALTNDIIEVPVGVGASRVIIQSRTVSASQVWDVVQFGGVSSMQEYLKRTDSVPTKDSKHLVESGGVYPALNIYDANWNTPAGSYFTLATAIASVPTQFKRVGLLLGFRESAAKVSIYMYNSGNLDAFNDISKWVSIEYKIPELGLLSANLRAVLGFNNTVFPYWAANTHYKVGDWIKTDKDICRCNTEHTSGETIDTSKFTSTSILQYLFEFGGNYIINYNTLIGSGSPIAFTELTQNILLSIKNTRRYPYALLMVRSTDGIYRYYQYKLTVVTDTYWGNTSNWFPLFESNKDYASIQSQIQEFTYLNTQTISCTNREYAYNTGNYNIGDTFDGSTTVNSVIDSWKIKVKKYDVISIKGYGAQGPRLWCTVDNDGKILAMADANYQASDYIDVKIRQDGYIYINARNNQPSFPYGVIHNTSLNFEYLAKAIEEIIEPPTYSPSNWLAMGDSITQGWYSYKDETYPNGHGVNNPVKGWVHKMSIITGKSVTNRGIGGTGYVCQGTSESDINARQLIDSMSAADFADKQLVTLAYGINDYKKGDISLGTMQDDVSVGGTVISNMRYVIEKIQQYNPLIKIIVITPFNAQGYYGQRLGDETTNYAIGYTKNGKTLQDYFNAFVEVCQYYGIQYIDATHTSLISRKAIPEQLPDGVHPSEDAHTMIAREMAERITIY